MKMLTRLIRQKQMLMLTIIAVSCGFEACAYAQVVRPQTGRVSRYRYGSPYWGWHRYYSPTDAISNRIRAQAELVRSIGENAVAHAEARKIRAEAFREEIANSVAYARAYWDRKEIYEAERMKRYTDPLTRARIHQSLTWERLKNHPELNDAAITNGKALNYLLDRLSGGILATNYSPGSIDSALLAKLTLSSDVLSGLRVREDLPGGKGRVFQVNSGESMDISRWPYALLDHRFSRQREKFEAARETALTEARTNSSISNDTMKNLLQAHDRLDSAFYEVYTREQRTLEGGKYFGQFLTAKRFLQSLAGEITRLQELQGKSGLDRGANFDGNDLIALVTHMSRNGLEFAPTRDGDEHAYHTTFQIMRDLYLTMADDDLASVEELKK